MKMYSTKEAADFLKVSVKTIKNWRKSGKLIPLETRENGYSYYSEEQLGKMKLELGKQTRETREKFSKTRETTENEVGNFPSLQTGEIVETGENNFQSRETNITFPTLEVQPVSTSITQTSITDTTCTPDVTTFDKGMTQPVTFSETYDTNYYVIPSKPMTFSENVTPLQNAPCKVASCTSEGMTTYDTNGKVGKSTRETDSSTRETTETKVGNFPTLQSGEIIKSRETKNIFPSSPVQNFNRATSMAINLTSSVTDSDIKAIAALSNDARADLAARINATDPFYLFDCVEGKTDEIICPICGSGSHGNKNTGIKPKNENGVWLYHCFAGNDCNGDLIKIIADANNLSTHGKDFFQVLAIAAKITNQNIFVPSDDKPKYKNISAPKKKSLVPVAEYSRLIESRENLPAFVEKQGGKWRGLSLETLQRLNWGFLHNYKHPDNNFVFPAVIIPNDLNGILARQINGDNKSNISPTATTTIFLPDSNEEFDLIITEGAINGASILQAIPNPTFGIIASGGTSGNKNVLAKLLQLSDIGKKFRVIISYDPDTPGQNAAYKLYTSLKNAGFYVFIHTIVFKKNNDLNDFLQHQGSEQLKEYIESALVDARKSFDEEKANILKASDKKQVPCTFAPIDDNSDFKSDSEINSLKVELQEIEKKIADFDSKKETAIADLTNIVSFDTETIFADHVLMAAAFAKNYNRQVFSELKSAIQNYKKTHKENGVALPDFNAAVSDFEKSILARRTELETTRSKIISKIQTLQFVAGNDFLKNFSFPDDFSISDKHGVIKIVNGKPITVCRLPLIIKEKFQSIEDSTFKYVLAYQENGKWKTSPPTSASIIFNQRKLADLSDFGVPVTSVNAFQVVDWLDAFKTENGYKFPLAKTVRRGGWYNFNGKDFFIDPRRTCEYSSENGEKCRVIVEDNKFTNGLKTAGNFDKWRHAYHLIKNYPVARFIVAASIAAPLLKILGERTFIFYVYGKTTSGKSTALKLGASLFGDVDKVTRNFNGTPKGLAELAAVTSDYSLLIDEKQGADEKLRDNLIQLVYNFAESQGRTRLDSKANLKDVDNWRSVVLMNGEEPLHNDNSTAGSFTRVLSLALKDIVIPAEVCAEIWDIIKTNYGFAFSPYIDEIFKYGFDNICEKYKEIVDLYKLSFSDILPEYCRYLAVITLADAFLNIALGVEKMTTFEDAVKIANVIFSLIPTISEIDDTAREIDFVKSFIVRNPAHFIGNPNYNQNLELFGEYDRNKGYLFIIAAVLNEQCIKAGFNPRKVSNDSVAKNFFVPADTVEKGKIKPFNTVKERIGVNNQPTRCYRIALERLKNED